MTAAPLVIMKRVSVVILLLVLLFVFGCTQQQTTNSGEEGLTDSQSSADAETAAATANDASPPAEEEKMPRRPEKLKIGLLSPRGCEGTGPVMLGASPMALEDLEKIVPMGTMSTVHITPTDHQYWESVGYDGASEDDINTGKFKIYAPAEGHIVDIEAHEKDYRVVIEHSCTFYTIFIHIDRLSDKIVSSIKPSDGDIKTHVWPRIHVKEGEIMGSIGTGKLDFSVVNADITLPGFVVPAHYEGEPWKIHTVDTFDYYEEPLKSQLLDKNIRRVPPLGGKIDYDIDVRLIGNWFKENTDGYRGMGSGNYWNSHLSIVYDVIDPSQVRISIGDFGGRQGQLQFGVTGNSPDPAEIDAADGVVKYELVAYEYYLEGTGRPWDRGKFASDVKSRNKNNDVRGVALLQLLPGRKLKAEFFPDKKAADVAGFTPSAMIYER